MKIYEYLFLQYYNLLVTKNNPYTINTVFSYLISMILLHSINKSTTSKVDSSAVGITLHSEKLSVTYWIFTTV